MRITVDIDEALLKDAMALTRVKHKSPAIAKAVEEYVRRAKAREFGRLIRESAFDYGEPDEAAEELENPIPPLGSTRKK